MQKVTQHTKDRILAEMIFVLWSLAVLLPALHAYDVFGSGANKGIAFLYLLANLVAFCYTLSVFFALLRARMRARSRERKDISWRLCLYLYVLAGLLVAIYFSLQTLI